ncbi:hypothetical protein HAX54_040488, partial [Datura stramonium]|nr:hypothetical protein [Datura stramonium]
EEAISIRSKGGQVAAMVASGVDLISIFTKEELLELSQGGLVERRCFTLLLRKVASALEDAASGIKRGGRKGGRRNIPKKDDKGSAQEDATRLRPVTPSKYSPSPEGRDEDTEPPIPCWSWEPRTLNQSRNSGTIPEHGEK